MALVDGQLVAGMRRTVTAKAVAFELRPLRALREHEVVSIHEAAARYADFLGLEPRVEIEAAAG
jgi:hypothetical protein